MRRDDDIQLSEVAKKIRKIPPDDIYLAFEYAYLHYLALMSTLQQHEVIRDEGTLREISQRLQQFFFCLVNEQRLPCFDYHELQGYEEELA